MVGVRGKYKGCETCRARRVKCDNLRPRCKKCLDNGRECAGYERETVFIVGTVQDFGRCSSHPPRAPPPNKKGKGKPAGSKSEERERLKLVPLEPLQPAWDDLISLSNSGTSYKIQIAALHTTPQMMVQDKDHDDLSRFDLPSLPPYQLPDVQSFLGEDDFRLRSHCMIHLVEDNRDEPLEHEGTDSICLFLYEHNNSVVFSDKRPRKHPLAQADPVRQLGPESFRSFPNHHFFVRIYRHNAICAALLNRKASFLAGPEWVTTPWEVHPKSFFDLLFDVVVLLPSILARTDRILPHDPTMQRRLIAQDLLANCLGLEKQFDEWHDSLHPDSRCQHGTFWIADPEQSDAQIPFGETFAFRDAVTAIMFIYYWTSLILFYPCVERLHQAIFQPVMDIFPQVTPTLPRHLLVDPLRYSPKEVRELAANVCRSLDFALNATVQPDMLVVPLFVVQEFYRAINESAGDGQLELMWCEAFRTRLATKGQNIADVIRDKKWQHVSAY